MNDGTGFGDWGFGLRGERVELARRESNGITVNLLWARETDVLTVAVTDVGGGDFELVLGENESPLDVFNHPYAYAALRGLATPQGPAFTAADSQSANAGQVCVNCDMPVHVANCAVCRALLRSESSLGFAKLTAYLGRWAQFDDWTRTPQTSSDDQR